MLPGPASRPLTGSPSGFACCKPFPSNFPFQVIDNISNVFGKTRQCISHGKYFRGLHLFSFPLPFPTQAGKRKGRFS